MCVLKICSNSSLSGACMVENERRKKKNRGERERLSGSGGLRAGKEEKDTCKLLVYFSLLSFIYFRSELINT